MNATEDFQRINIRRRHVFRRHVFSVACLLKTLVQCWKTFKGQVYWRSCPRREFFSLLIKDIVWSFFGVATIQCCCTPQYSSSLKKSLLLCWKNAVRMYHSITNCRFLGTRKCPAAINDIPDHDVQQLRLVMECDTTFSDIT